MCQCVVCAVMNLFRGIWGNFRKGRIFSQGSLYSCRNPKGEMLAHGPQSKEKRDYMSGVNGNVVLQKAHLVNGAYLKTIMAE